jgi:hypothetical protein
MRGAAVAVCFLLFLTGCTTWDSTVDKMFSSHSAQPPQPAVPVTNIDRCIDFMLNAYPDARFDVTNKRATTHSNESVIDIQGTRNDVPAGGKMPRVIAVQCRFESGVMAEFHWTSAPLP